jgi:hypothetical protein
MAGVGRNKRLREEATKKSAPTGLLLWPGSQAVKTV